jgi:hypothetical protein
MNTDTEKDWAVIRISLGNKTNAIAAVERIQARAALAAVSARFQSSPELISAERERLVPRIISTDGGPVSVGDLQEKLAAMGFAIVHVGAKS